MENILIVTKTLEMVGEVVLVDWLRMSSGHPPAILLLEDTNVAVSSF